MLHRHLDEPEPVLEHEHRRLDLRVVARVVAAKSAMPLRLSAWKPDVVSVTRWPERSETSRANHVIPSRRPSGGRYAVLVLAEARPGDDVRLAALERVE